MLTTIATLKNPTRLVNIRAKIDGVSIPAKNIINFSISSKLTSDSTYTIGCATSKVLTISLARIPLSDPIPFVVAMRKIRVEVGIYSVNNFYDIASADASKYQWYNLGTYYIDSNSIDQDTNMLTFTAYDRMDALGRKKFSTKLKFPVRMNALLEEISTNTKATFTSGLAANPYVEGVVGKTYREVLCELAEICGGNWLQKADGTFTISRFDKSTPTWGMTAVNYESFKLTTDGMHQVGGIHNEVDKLPASNTSGSGSGSIEGGAGIGGSTNGSYNVGIGIGGAATKETYKAVSGDLVVNEEALLRPNLNDLSAHNNTWGFIINLKNNSINSQERIDNLFTRAYLPYSYYGYELTCQGMPHLELGDVFKLTNKHGQEYELHVLEHTLTFDGGLMSNIKAEGFASDSGGETYNSRSSTTSVSGQIANISSLLQASTAYINDLYVKNETVQNLVATKADIAVLDAVNARIDDIDAEEISTERLEAALAKIDVLSVNTADTRYAKIEDLQATNANITNLTTNKADLSHLQAVEAQIREIEAGKIDVDTLKAALADIGSLTTESADLRYAKIGDLTASNARLDNIEAGYIKTGGINSKTGVIDEIFNNYMLSDTFVADNITAATGQFTKYLTGVNIVGDNIVGGTIKADKLILTGDDGLVYQINASSSGLSQSQLDSSELYKDKIDGSVIVSESITGTQIAANTITSNHIQSNTIIGDNIKSNTITADKLATASVTTDKLAAGAITADKLNVEDLSAISASIAGWGIESDGLTAPEVTNTDEETGETYTYNASFSTSGDNYLTVSSGMTVNEQTRSEQINEQTTIDKHGTLHLHQDYNNDRTRKYGEKDAELKAEGLNFNSTNYHKLWSTSDYVQKLVYSTKYTDDIISMRVEGYSLPENTLYKDQSITIAPDDGISFSDAFRSKTTDLTLAGLYTDGEVETSTLLVNGGSTFEGALSGTTATFSGNVTAQSKLTAKTLTVSENITNFTTGKVDSLEAPANGQGSIDIKFGKTYKAPPTVVACFMSASSGSYLGTCSCAVSAITTTGFTLRVFNASSAKREPAIQWMAFGY